MKRLILVGSVLLWMLSLQSEDACAASEYDGEWTGSATATGGQCKPALVTLIVSGKVVTGHARFERDVLNINGTILENGSFGATLGFRRLRGKFTENTFEAVFEVFDCAWKMTLKLKKQ